MPSSIAVQSSLPSSHAARRALRGLENTTPSLFSPSKLKVRTYINLTPRTRTNLRPRSNNPLKQRDPPTFRLARGRGVMSEGGCVQRSESTLVPRADCGRNHGARTTRRSAGTRSRRDGSTGAGLLLRYAARTPSCSQKSKRRPHTARRCRPTRPTFAGAHSFARLTAVPWQCQSRLHSAIVSAPRAGRGPL